MLSELIEDVCNSRRWNSHLGDHVMVNKRSLELLHAISPTAISLEQSAGYLTRAMRVESDLLTGKSCVHIGSQDDSTRYVALAVELANTAQSALSTMCMRGLPFPPVFLDSVERSKPEGLRVGLLIGKVESLIEQHLPDAAVVEVVPGYFRTDTVQRLTLDDVFPKTHAGVVAFATAHRKQGYVVHLQAMQEIEDCAFAEHSFEALMVRTYGGFSEAHEIARVLQYAFGV